MKRWLGLTRNVVVLGFVSFFTDLSTEMIVPLLPFFLVSELGASVAFVGLVEGFAEAAIHIFKIPAGLLSDRLRRRKILVVLGYAFSALTKPLLAWTRVPAQVLGLRLLDRAGKGVRDAPRDALIGESSQAATRGRAFGFHRALDTAGAVAGALLTTGLLAAGFTSRQIFAVAGLGGAASVLLIVFFIHDIPRVIRTKLRFSQSAHLPKVFWLVVAAAAIFSVGQFGSAFYVLRASQLGFAVTLLPIIFIVFNITHALLSTPAGILSDRIGRKAPLVLGWLGFVGSTTLLALGYNGPILWSAIVLYGIFLALTDGVVRALISDLVSADHRATAFGLYGVIIGFAVLIANTTVGTLLQNLGPAYAFGLPVITSVMAILVLLAIKIPKRAAK